MTVRIHRVGHERAHVLDLPGPARIKERRVQIQIGVRPLDGCAPQQQKRPQESVQYRSEEMDMDAGEGSCVTSYLQCGGRLGTHTGWSEILRTCPRAVCTGVHPSLLGHRILGVVSRFKRLDQDVEAGPAATRLEGCGAGPRLATAPRILLLICSPFGIHY